MFKEVSEQKFKQAQRGIMSYLDMARRAGRIDQQLYESARRETYPALRDWLTDPDIAKWSPHLRAGISQAIREKRWADLVNSFRQTVRFGTGGIRGMMAFDKGSIVRLKKEGIDAPILKGPNTLNNIVLLKTAVGVAQFGNDQRPRFQKVVVGYDSRIRGHDFAAAVAQVFLAYGYTVYFFDEPCPYPEVTYAIPDALVKADVGILISASHNDYRYNGFKLSCSNGSQFDPEERVQMYDDYIAKVAFRDIKLCPFSKAPKGRLWFLGGKEPVEDCDYAGRADFLINMHERHLAHVKGFLLTPDLAERQKASKRPLKIAYCAFHGSGRLAVPRLLRDVGFREVDVQVITEGELNELDGLFPSFVSAPGREQQPDPGDPRAAEVAVKAYKKQYPGQFGDLDVLISTDPDADRCGIVIKVPRNQQHLYGNRDYYLLPADDAWALILRYRLEREIEKYGSIKNVRKKFVVLSVTTSDSIVRVARKYGLGVVKTWVGFASLAAATQLVWNRKTKELLSLREGRDGRYVDICHPVACNCEDMDDARSINMAAMEQSNGFSILGGPPPDRRSLGQGGHVRDKDGTFAALLMAELAAWGKERGMSLLEMLDRYIYLDPQVGLFVNLYEPDPLDGEYPGIEGDRIKKAILRRALACFQSALAGDLAIGGCPVKSACIYRTGKYDEIYPPTYDFQFPDEGVRFFLDEERLDHVTVRPSGTGNSLRFHIQLHAPATKADLLTKKKQLAAKGAKIMTDLREILKAPRHHG